MYDQYEIEHRDLEERYKAHTIYEYEEMLLNDDGSFKFELLKKLIHEQLDGKIACDEERDRFAKEVEAAARSGASHREIWGDGEGVSFYEMLDIKEEMFDANLSVLRFVAKRHGILITIKKKETITWEVEYAK